MDKAMVIPTFLAPLLLLPHHKAAECSKLGESYYTETLGIKNTSQLLHTAKDGWQFAFLPLLIFSLGILNSKVSDGSSGNS